MMEIKDSVVLAELQKHEKAMKDLVSEQSEFSQECLKAIAEFDTQQKNFHESLSPESSDFLGAYVKAYIQLVEIGGVRSGYPRDCDEEEALLQQVQGRESDNCYLSDMC
jgi:hypothetical protein